MNNFKITARCALGHSQEIVIDGSLGSEWAKHYAGLLDGTSPFYVHPPGPADQFCKCHRCAFEYGRISKIHCTVEEVPSK